MGTLARKQHQAILPPASASHAVVLLSMNELHGNGAIAEQLLSDSAARGVQGGGSEYPFRSILEQAFGHDLSSVKAHYGRDSSEACGSLDAESFAMGSRVAFSETPSLWLAAHEAAHVIQQRAGMQVAGGMGKPGDSLEQQANAVADRVIAGRSAADLLPSAERAAQASEITAIQCYNQEKISDDLEFRLSDDLQLMILQEGCSEGEEPTGGTKKFWSAADLENWNLALQSVSSVIQLGQGPAQGPGIGSVQYTPVNATNLSNHTSGDQMEIWADCGRSGRDIMGVGQGTGLSVNGKMAAIYQMERDAWILERLWDWYCTGHWNENLKVMEVLETIAHNPKQMRDEILSRTMRLPAEEALEVYARMSPDEQDAYDRKVGINRYAVANVGEGYTMASGGEAFPASGPEDAWRDTDKDGLIDTWTFHWAPVIAASGQDHVTLENYATGDKDEKNQDWQYQMYSSTPGQTFHDNHKDSKTHGDMPFTLRVRKAADEPPIK